MYDDDTKRRLFPTFVKDVILTDEMKRRPEMQTLIDDLRDNAYDNYDDIVKEDIGRILLEYEPNVVKLSGGKTRKRSRRMVRRHSKTRNCKPKSSDKKTRHRRRCTNVHKNKQTRKCVDVMDVMG